MYSKSDAPAEKADASVVCPACGEALRLAKAPAPAPKEAASPKPSNAAKMPMNQLKEVIKAGSVA